MPIIGFAGMVLIVVGFLVGHYDAGWGVWICLIGLSMLVFALVAGNGKGSDEK